MNRLFAGYLMCLKAIILLGFSAQFVIPSAYAAAVPTMLSIPTQTIVAEQPFSYLIMAGAAGQPVGVRLINAPKGATLTDNGDSSHEFRWTPPADVGEQTVIIVQAYSLSDPNLISTQRVLFQRGSAEQGQAVAPAVTADVVVASNNAVGSRFLTPLANSTPAAPAGNKTAVTAGTLKKFEATASNSTSTGYTSKFKTKPSVSVATNTSKPTALKKAIAPDSAAEASDALAAITTPSSGTKKTGSTAPTEIVAVDTDTTVPERPELPKLDLQRLTVGEDFEFFIRPEAVDDTQVQLSAKSLPIGASFEDVFEGSKMLRWTPTEDQVGEHQMLLVLVAENATAPSLRTEREVMFVVEPAPEVEQEEPEPEPELEFEPMSAQIVSAGRKVNIRVEPKVSDDTIALLQVDRLPAGGSFDKNKDGTRTFHWPTTQADQGEHTFRFTAIHPDNAELVANVNVLIVVGSPDGPASGPANETIAENAPPSPELDAYPSADSPSPSAALPSPEMSPSGLPLSPESSPSVDSPSPEPYPSADTASPEPLAVRPTPQPRPSLD